MTNGCGGTSAPAGDAAEPNASAAVVAGDAAGAGTDDAATANTDDAAVTGATANGAIASTDSRRDSFRSKRGFILACIGSAVGMGNIWLFPTRVSAYGGGTFILPYLIFVLLIGSTGVIGEMSFGRAMRGGPIKAFGSATERRFGTRKPGEALGLLPVISSLGMAIGYTVVLGWIFCYVFDALNGSLASMQGVDAFAGQFVDVSEQNAVWQCIAAITATAILVFGVGRGIERANEVMMPLFFLLFVGLAIYVATLPGAGDGYAYIFKLDPQGLLDPTVWVFALGQAFFSLSIAGNGTLIYGSYLGDNENVPQSAKYVALFDTIAAMLAALVIIPAMASAGQQLSQGGPGLLFIYLPTLFSNMPGGPVIMAVFFVAVLFGGLSSLINFFEAPIATLQESFGLDRTKATFIIGSIVLVASLIIASIVSDWMDFCSIYLCPIGALIAAVMFFWVCGKKFCLAQVNKGRKKALGGWFYPLAKYVFCGATLVVLVLGSILGGIG
jgi:NSS family neurotransmitter:Na+ symporter